MSNDDRQNLGYGLTILAEYHRTNLGAEPRHDLAAMERRTEERR